ncbi:hypothetical protein PMAYCL1PPCAC_15513, partial [Pristionchus mayeri]
LQFFLFFLFLGSANPLKFLAYSPQVAKSHVNFMGKITDVLIDAGHEVVMLSPILDSSLGYAGTKKARVVEVPQCPEAHINEEFMQNSNAANAWTMGDSLGAFFGWADAMASWINQCNATIVHPGLMQSLRDEKFDAAYAESFDFCAPGLFHLLGIDKWAVTDSLAIIDANFFYTQTPSNPTYQVPMMGGNMGEAMSFFERLSNLFTFCFSHYFNELYFPLFDAMFITHDRKITPVKELFALNSFVFTNSEPLVDFPRPSSARILDIGGIVISSGHKPLNSTWSSLLDLRPQTVFISFGTVAKAYLMPESYKKSVVEVIKSFPQVTFIWKYEQPSDRISEGIPNLIESTWVPQSDLLHDPRVSAFITHCGQGSTTEAIAAGIPLIVIPVAYDQLRNAQQVKRNGHGIMMEKTELASPEKLRNAVKEILETKRLASVISELSIPFSYREKALKQIFVRNMEFLAKHGPLRQLDHYGRHLNFLQYYLIDVIGAVIGVILLALAVSIFAIKIVVGKLIQVIGIAKKKVE